MTSSHQKRLERSILDFYLHVAALDGKVVAQESPDFIVTMRNRRIGVEITEYHQPTYSGHRFSRSQVEAEWNKIRAAVVEYRDSHAGLENISVQLSFTDLNVPSAKERHSFIEAIHYEIDQVKPNLNHRFTTIRIGDQHPPVLRQSLDSIDVRIVNCDMEWDWNHAAAWVGSSDAELAQILRPKLNVAITQDIDEFHLVMAADGSSGGSYTGYLSPELLDGWTTLNAALDHSHYDVFAIIIYGCTCIWRRSRGWALIRHDCPGLVVRRRRKPSCRPRLRLPASAMRSAGLIPALDGVVTIGAIDPPAARSCRGSGCCGGRGPA